MEKARSLKSRRPVAPAKGQQMMQRARLVITVGGANGERVLSPEQFRPGMKHTLPQGDIVAGGSAVNHSCRLMAGGVQAFPILPVAADEVGKIVVATLELAANAGGCKLNTDTLCMNDGSTPFSTIIVQGSQRTIFTEVSDRTLEGFHRQYERRISAFEKLYPNRKADAVMIGHVHSDRASPPGEAGGLSQLIMTTFSSQGIPVFTNFGNAQFAQRTVRWAQYLPLIECFQLDIDEIRQFCEPVGARTLEEILEWFKDKCTVVITMERLGAVGRRKGSSRVVFAWPYDLKPEEIKDTTGAGDAFGAGVVSSAIERPLTDDDAFAAALEQGRVWGAHACKTPGGANQCPTSDVLKHFKDDHQLFLRTQQETIGQARPLLRILDRAFPRKN